MALDVGSGRRSIEDVLSDLVTTEQADVTGETLVKAHRASSASNISAGTWTNIPDTEDEDNQNEFNENSNQRFNPDETAEYIVVAAAEWASASDQDRIRFRVQDVDGSTTIAQSPNMRVSGTASGYLVTFMVDLSANTNYEVQTVNRDSQASLASGGANDTTFISIMKNPINP